jgi:aromatic ring-opening dioxygenase catalytic subunit (LigB family)
LSFEHLEQQLVFHATDTPPVNEDQSNPLVYDFYGFPSEYYQQTFVSRGNNQMLSDVKDALKGSDVRFSTAKRGLDHGVWVPFKVAFAGRTDIPIIQVSLPGDSNPISAAKLGRALAPLREQGYGIMGTGQAVHNLRDFSECCYIERAAVAVTPALEVHTRSLGLHAHW